ncbi:hypothetical protein HJ009_08685 [Vibrio parahaemolyticus]|nr:hypothetical protein [Vibrio parahaemolyticus]
MIQAKNCTVLAISLLCLAASSVTNATQLNSEQRAAIKEKSRSTESRAKRKNKNKIRKLNTRTKRKY